MADFPTGKEIQIAIYNLLSERGPTRLRVDENEKDASDYPGVLRILAEQFELTQEQIEEQEGKENPYNKWANRLRTYREILAVKGYIQRPRIIDKETGQITRPGPPEGEWRLVDDTRELVTGKSVQGEGKKREDEKTPSGPPPHLAGKWVYHNIQREDGWVYILRWGETDIYKYGYTNNIPRRLKEIRHHIPNEKNEFPDHATWLPKKSSKELPIEEAYELEQSVKREVERLKYNTAFERFRCTPGQMKNLVKSFPLLKPWEEPWNSDP